jgi:hypothetical protein
MEFDVRLDARTGKLGRRRSATDADPPAQGRSIATAEWGSL